jgi:two-component system, chemotaxis family, sensor kinase CheA
MITLPDDCKDKTVLLVEDSEDNIFSFKVVLEAYDLNVCIARTGEEAIDSVQKGRYDIILMDIRLPLMDGYETIQAIRKICAERQPPIIAVTAQAMPTDRAKCLAAGANDYISKPVENDLLLSKIRDQLVRTKAPTI